ncbi:hypothetical protein TNCV_2668241 [Trichonephila clavipes]|nr:hypothetical protein TNCV_2668241 [Trichonephila clavipes]
MRTAQAQYHKFKLLSVRRSREDRVSVENDEHAERPQTSRSPKNIDTVLTVVRTNKLKTIELLAESVTISVCHMPTDTE